MPLLLAGINHRKADISIREKLSLDQIELNSILTELLKEEQIEECFILTTCNRTEIYAYCAEHTELVDKFISLLEAVREEKFADNPAAVFYTMEDDQAARHLFRVTAGLDSMVLGETQILGQVKEAYHTCLEMKTTGTYLHNLCQKALATGKKVHTFTYLGRHAVTYGYAAAELARRIFKSLTDHTMMVIGTGEMAELTLQNLFELKVGEVIVASRRRERAAALAAKFRGKTINLTNIEQGLQNASVIICATTAPHYIITRERLAPYLEGSNNSNNQILIIDLGLPRNVEPEVAHMQGVHLYNLDQIEDIISTNMKNRRAEALKAEEIITDQVKAFTRWYQRQQVVPLIAALRKNGEETRLDKLKQFENELAGLSEKEKTAVDNLTRSLVNELLREPVVNMKDMSLDPEFHQVASYSGRLFGIDASADETTSLPQKQQQRKVCAR